MSHQSFATGYTQDELQQQLNDARQKELKAKTKFHQALKHFRGPGADQPCDDSLTETELKDIRCPFLEQVNLDFANSMVGYLEQKLKVKNFKETCNSNGHELDLARIDLHVGQLQHHAAVETAGSKLRKYEAKIAAGNASYVTRKAHKERDIKRYGVLAKQNMDHLQKMVESWEKLVALSKVTMAHYEETVTGYQKILRVCEKTIAKYKKIKKQIKTEKLRRTKTNKRLRQFPH